jgi:hypothetical protein
MPRSSHRFARQNGGGPPPEFPLASSCPGIVHRLSGPNVDAVAPGTLLVLGPRCALPKSRAPAPHFLSALGFATLTLASPLDSLVRVSRRVVSLHPGADYLWHMAVVAGRLHPMHSACSLHSKQATSQHPPSLSTTSPLAPLVPGPCALLLNHQQTPCEPEESGPELTSVPGNCLTHLDSCVAVSTTSSCHQSIKVCQSEAFPFQQFHALFTPFPGCFSSFPHGTCSLSVSCPYLALDGVYHPLWTAFPSNPTLPARAPRARPGIPRGSHPLRPSFPERSMPRPHTLVAAVQTTIRLAFSSSSIPNLGSSLFARRYWGNPC